jgi:hypothetical protein
VDIDELLKPADWLPGICTVAQALDALEGHERHEQVAAAVANPLVLPENVSKAIGHLLGKTAKTEAIRRHRSNGCDCP